MQTENIGDTIELKLKIYNNPIALDWWDVVIAVLLYICICILIDMRFNVRLN